MLRNNNRLASRGCAVVLAMAMLALKLVAAEIHEAADQGDLEKVKALLAADPARVNERDRESKTPLHFAAAKGHVEIVKLLLNNQADVNARSSSGITPMYLAKGFGRVEVVALLAKSGGALEIIKPAKTVPPIKVPDRKPLVVPVTRTQIVIPIIAAARTNGVAALQAMLAVNSAAVGITDSNQWTALHHAVEQGHLSAVEILLRSNANVNASAQGEVAPLHIAVQRTNKAMVELLITNRADVNARTFIQATPLLQAAAVGKAGEIVKILLQAGAELNARDKYGNSALLLAAAAEPDGVAELLIQAGADVTVQEKAAGFTALHHAVLRGNRPLVELLLAKKADCQAPLADGETPLSLALFEDRKEIAELLRQQGAKLPPEKPLTEIERSLVEDYRRYHQMLATGTFEEIRKRQQELSPTRAEVNRIFLKSAEIAWDILERVRRDEALAWGAASRNADDKQSFLAMMRNGARMGEYLRIEILPASPSVKSAQARNLIAADAPVYQLQIKRRGGETFTVGDYYLVGQRWIIMPALSQVFQELAPPP